MKTLVSFGAVGSEFLRRSSAQHSATGSHHRSVTSTTVSAPPGLATEHLHIFTTSAFRCSSACMLINLVSPGVAGSAPRRPTPVHGLSGGHKFKSRSMSPARFEDTAPWALGVGGRAGSQDDVGPVLCVNISREVFHVIGCHDEAIVKPREKQCLSGQDDIGVDLLVVGGAEPFSPASAQSSAAMRIAAVVIGM